MIGWRWFLVACTGGPVATPEAPPDPCAIAQIVAPGPLSTERAGHQADRVAVARLHIREARLTSDAGFYTLAETALRCRLEETADDPEAVRLLAHVRIQFHQFQQVASDLRALTASPTGGTSLDWALLGDAEMEQGELDAAAEAYDKALALEPGLEIDDRIAWLRWLRGDVTGALELETRAVAARSGQDPERYAWVLTRLGWLRALENQPSPELDQALALLPDYAPARLARGRVRLHAQDLEGAKDDLLRAGRTVEAVRALREIDPSVSVEGVRTQDPRGYAMWLTPNDPARAKALLDEEWTLRRDATTQMARAYASFLVHDPAIDPGAEAEAALATGIVEPRVLRMGGLILGDDSLLDRAEAMGPGLLPSEHRARAAP